MIKLNSLFAMAMIVGLASCDDAQVASHNLTKAADNFEIMRRVVFFNGIADTYLMTIEGRCSIYDDRKQLEVTCKIDHGNYKKHFLGLSDNVTYFVEQMDAVNVSVNHHRITFKPQNILPDIDIRGDASEAVTPRNQ